MIGQIKLFLEDETVLFRTLSDNSIAIPQNCMSIELHASSITGDDYGCFHLILKNPFEPEECKSFYSNNLSDKKECLHCGKLELDHTKLEGQYTKADLEKAYDKGFTDCKNNQDNKGIDLSGSLIEIL